jgi:putative transposase
MIRGYKYRIYPNRVQVEQLKQMFGNARFVYNWALAKRIEAYESEKKTPSAYDLMKELTELKKQDGKPIGAKLNNVKLKFKLNLWKVFNLYLIF